MLRVVEKLFWKRRLMLLLLMGEINPLRLVVKAEDLLINRVSPMRVFMELALFYLACNG